MMNNTVIAPRPSFTRMLTTMAIKDLVKEARRVNYAVEVKKDDNGSIWGYEVRDDNALVFKGMQMRRGVWGTTFSTLYWKDPLDLS